MLLLLGGSEVVKVFVVAWHRVVLATIFFTAIPRPWEPNFKVTVSQNGYFLKGLNILISIFCVLANGFQGLSKVFNYPLQLLAFYMLL
jgi:hypothetical protein